MMGPDAIVVIQYITPDLLPGLILIYITICRTSFYFQTPEEALHRAVIRYYPLRLTLLTAVGWALPRPGHQRCRILDCVCRMAGTHKLNGVFTFTGSLTSLQAGRKAGPVSNSHGASRSLQRSPVNTVLAVRLHLLMPFLLALPVFACHGSPACVFADSEYMFSGTSGSVRCWHPLSGAL